MPAPRCSIPTWFILLCPPPPTPHPHPTPTPLSLWLSSRRNGIFAWHSYLFYFCSLPHCSWLCWGTGSHFISVFPLLRQSAMEEEASEEPAIVEQWFKCWNAGWKVVGSSSIRVNNNNNNKNKNLKQEWLLAFLNKIQTRKWFKRTLIYYDTDTQYIQCKFSRYFPLSSYKERELGVAWAQWEG